GPGAPLDRLRQPIFFPCFCVERVPTACFSGAIKRVSHRQPTLRSGYEARFPTPAGCNCSLHIVRRCLRVVKMLRKALETVVSKLSRVCKTSLTNTIYGDKVFETRAITTLSGSLSEN